MQADTLAVGSFGVWYELRFEVTQIEAGRPARVQILPVRDADHG